MKARARNFATMAVILATRAVSACSFLGLMNSLQTLRLKRLSAAMDMIDAGTRAPIAIAANPKPAKALGNSFSKRAGMALLAP